MELFDHLSTTLKSLAQRIDQGERISQQEALLLGREAPLSLLSILATRAKERHSEQSVFYNRNFHLEPTNICLFNCKFCSYRRPADSPESWSYSLSELLEQVESRAHLHATEVHIVGGVHPKTTLEQYEELISEVHKRMPQAAIKAFTAIELRYMIERAGLDLRTGLERLQKAGMSAIPGGGAEIFAPRVRTELCPEKGTAKQWLEVHEVAHALGLPTNATILYGHIETLEERIDHLARLRELQDRTGGFDALIPLKYRNRHNALGLTQGEVSIVEDMRMMALSRLFLDNFAHLKAYWPMFGKSTAQLALGYGADDLDGTIDDSTRIYTLAGVEEQRPSMSSSELEQLIREAGYEPIERDTFYNPVKM